MRRACRGTASCTSGHHPEPHPELFLPSGGGEGEGERCRPVGRGNSGRTALPARGDRWQRIEIREGDSKAMVAEARTLEPSAEHLVGRAVELASLERTLDELYRSRRGALALFGEPGIGKTRLLTELGARAELRGHLVLYGSASELERDLPFSVFVDAIDEYVEGLDAKQLATLDDDVQAEIAHVFPSLDALGGGHEVALQQERYRTHRAVRALLQHLARTKPLVLALDDFHWADSGSVELLGALLRHPPTAVLIALAMRPRQMPERLSSALERAHRAATLTHIALEALTPGE